MTSKRNLGPVLALTGAGIAVAAVIAGFILVGGPGDARDRRLDQMTMGRVHDVLNIVQCAFNETGTPPATVDDARKVTFHPTNTGETQPCAYGTTAEDVPVATGASPARPGDVSYERGSGNHIRICANFRRPSDSEACNGICYRDGPSWAYPQMDAARPAGVHCFDLDLIKTGDTASLPNSHAGHMDVFE